MKALHFVLMFVIILSFLALTHADLPVQAQERELSVCERMNLPGYNGIYWRGKVEGVFYAGDTLMINVSHASARTSARLLIGKRLVSSTGIPGTLTYTFPRTVRTTAYWTSNTNVSWWVVCKSAIPPTPVSSPVPGTDQALPVGVTDLVTPDPPQAQEEVSKGCATMHRMASTWRELQGQSSSYGFSSRLKAGDVVTASFWLAPGTSSAHISAKVTHVYGPETLTVPVTWTYTIPSTDIYDLVWTALDYTPETGFVFLRIDCGRPAVAPTSPVSPPAPEYAETLPPSVPLPVMGRFLVPTEAYWAPGQLDTRVITLPAGQSAWVLGIDQSGVWYQIVWGASLLWVPVETMGPNYDALWQGWPLPTGVVN